MRDHGTRRHPRAQGPPAVIGDHVLVCPQAYLSGCGIEDAVSSATGDGVQQASDAPNTRPGRRYNPIVGKDREQALGIGAQSEIIPGQSINWEVQPRGCGFRPLP